MLLFEAPVDFDEEVFTEYKRWMPETSDPEQVTVWVCNPLSGEITELALAQFPNLRILATPSTGTNHIDLEACNRLGVKVISLTGDREALETISASAEFTFKLLLDAFRMSPAQELQGKKVVTIGHGRIGKRICKWVSAFDGKPDWYDPRAGDSMISLAAWFAYADAVVICCSLTGETTGMITGPLLRSMKTNGVLVNTARGEVIDEQALVWVMQERPDLRVALDVVCGETNGTANPELLRSLGAIVTPHIAGATLESRTKAAQIILRLLQKEMRETVNE